MKVHFALSSCGSFLLAATFACKSPEGGSSVKDDEAMVTDSETSAEQPEDDTQPAPVVPPPPIPVSIVKLKLACTFDGEEHKLEFQKTMPINPQVFKHHINFSYDGALIGGGLASWGGPNLEAQFPGGGLSLRRILDGSYTGSFTFGSHFNHAEAVCFRVGSQSV